MTVAKACSVLTLLVLLGCSSIETGRTDWWLAEPISDTAIPVVVYTGSGSCNSFDRVDVKETDDEVAIRAFVERTGERDCTADYNWHFAPVTLDQPLGERKLTGCTAPTLGLRAPDIPHEQVQCRTLIWSEFLVGE